MDHADKAEQLIRSGLNCAQAVSGAFCDLYDGITEEQVLNLSSPLGGGFARKRELCGAVSGMGVAFGLLFGTHTAGQKMETYKNAAELTDRFIDRYGSIVCSELLEKTPDDKTTPREVPLTEQEKQDFHWPCIDYVRGAAQIFENYFSERASAK